MLIGVTRAVSPRINDCELTFLTRETIDLQRATKQHRAYEQLLSNLGVHVVSLPADPQLPDAVFVEDAAVVVEEGALICRIGAASRRSETPAIAAALRPFRPLKFVREPAVVDGGDVLRIDRTFFVGLSQRTNRDGVAEVGRFLAAYGYEVRPVAVRNCLHLKTGCTYVGRGVVLINPSWVDAAPFEGLELIPVDKAEPGAANALTVKELVLLPETFPHTRTRLEKQGFRVKTLDISELQKAEAGLTCMSIIFSAPNGDACP
jgi:dimethylargininase